MGGKSSPPPAPDYAGAAVATAQGNLEATRAATAANRVNQFTPYGALIYSHAGDDPDAGWSVIQSLSSPQQAILDSTNQLNQGLMRTANSGLNYANDVLSRPGVDMSKLPSVGINPGQTYQDAIMSRLQPNIDAERNRFDVQMANQGIAPGTEAYANAQRALDQRQNDLRSSATVQGFNTGLSANQTAFQQQAYNQMQPINVINALRTGSQVTNPQFTNVPQQQTTTGANMLGAAQSQGQYDMGAYNAQVGQQNEFTKGLFSLGGAALGAPVGTFSDRRLKSDVIRVGTHPLGIGIYEYTIFGRRERGVMADEALQVKPDAVSQHPSGYLMVDYDRLQ